MKTALTGVMLALGMTASLSGCGGSSGSGGGAVETGMLTDRVLPLQDLVREYHLYVPAAYEGAPVVLLFHGHSRSHDDMIGRNGQISPYQKWFDIAARDNVIVVVPNGYNNGSEKGWNDCRNDAFGNSNADDVAFMRALVDLVVDTYKADPNRVYATGTSNGGHFSIRLGLEMADKLTAFAAVAAANSVNTKCLPSSTPVSALFMNGTGDPLLPYSGGQMTGNRGVVYSTADTMSDWISRNGAETTAINSAFADINNADGSTVTRHEYPSGNNGTAVVLYRVLDGGHNEPSIETRLPSPIGNQNGDIEMADEVWAFFVNKVRT